MNSLVKLSRGKNEFQRNQAAHSGLGIRDPQRQWLRQVPGLRKVMPSVSGYSLLARLLIFPCMDDSFQWFSWLLFSSVTLHPSTVFHLKHEDCSHLTLQKPPVQTLLICFGYKGLQLINHNNREPKVGSHRLSDGAIWGHVSLLTSPDLVQVYASAGPWYPMEMGIIIRYANTSNSLKS